MSEKDRTLGQNHLALLHGMSDRQRTEYGYPIYNISGLDAAEREYRLTIS